MMMHTYNSSTQVAEAGRLEFETSLSYIARPCIKILNNSHIQNHKIKKMKKLGISLVWGDHVSLCLFGN
jgi:hypothetical protein